jgi:CBS domain-containing protein
MRAKDIMTRTVVTVHSDDPIHHAAVLMTDCKVTSLPVLDEDDRVIGIISESDVIRDRLPSDPRSHVRVDPECGAVPGRLRRRKRAVAGAGRGRRRDDPRPLRRRREEIVQLLARSVPGVIRVHTT